VLAKQLDPTRCISVATRSKYEAEEGINSASDVLGVNLYCGWYRGNPEDFPCYVDENHAKYPKIKYALSEYGAGASITQHEYPAEKPDIRGPWHPEEWQNTIHEQTWKQIEMRPFIFASFLWNMFDFAVDNRSEGDHAGRNDKGLVTYDRKTKKDAFYWYKANWNPEPMVYITSRRYSPRPAGMTNLKVYSNCGNVELQMDGVSLGSRESKEKMLLWNNITLSEGRHTLTAISNVSGTLVTDSITITVEKKQEFLK
jgi:beta-galactosidase